MLVRRIAVITLSGYLLASLATLVAAQQTSVDYVTVTAQPSSTSAVTTTGVGSLNDADPSRTAAVSGSSSVWSRVSTSIPSIDFGTATVPYLLQRPVPTTASVKKDRPIVQTAFDGCSDETLDLVDPQYRINISAVYAQFDSTLSAPHLGATEDYTEGLLRIAGIGAVAAESRGASNGTFSAIQVQSRFLTFNIFSNLTYLCDELAPTSPDPTSLLVGHSSCIYGPGTVGFGVDIPLNSTYPLGTIWTRILLIDSSTPALAIACIDVPVSRYDADRWYWRFMLWLPLALFIGFFVAVTFARIITAAATRTKAFRNRAREGRAPSLLKDHVNPVIISALSGQGMVLSPALLRYATPGCWEILLHLQFIAAIAMMSVRWPDFSYPFFARASWASLVGNVTFVQSMGDQSLVDPSATSATLPTGEVGAQFGNTSSPLYLNSSAPQSLLNLNGTFTGIPAYARMIGLQTADLFGTCLAIWLVIIAVFAAVAFAGWLIDSITNTVSKIKQTREDSAIDYQLTPNEANGRVKGEALYTDADGNVRDTRSHSYGFLGVWTRGVHLSPRLHFAALHGNIVRALAMFHLPITIFSVFQFVNRSEHTGRTIGLAIAAFAIISVLLPLWLLWRVAVNPTRKLYDDIDTLLALGPIYNVFSPGSQLFWAVMFIHSLALGIVVGAGYQSGSAQAIVLLVLEVLLALATNLWLPWGEGAIMGPISFMTSVLRVTTAVLVVLLCPIVDISSQAAAWITYVVLVLQGIFFAAAAVILVFKLVEAVIRIFGRVAYDERANARSGGIGGAMRQIRRRRDKILQLNKPSRPTHRSRNSNSSQQMMLSNGGFSNSRPNSLIASHMSMPKGEMMSPSGAPIALTRSRHASFASYLDYGNVAAASTTSPGAQDPLRSARAGPYSAYFTHEGDDEDADIMAAMPPTSPGPWGATVLHYTGSTEPEDAVKGGQKAGSGFQRVGGGRATDVNPYATLPGGAKGSTSAMRYGTGGAYKGDGSSTAAAAQFARAQSRREARRPSTRSIGGIFMSRRNVSTRRPQADPVFSEGEEDEDPWAGTWGTSTLSTQHGPWNGIAKMQAALNAMRERLAGQKRQNPSSSGHGIPEDAEEEEQNLEGGGGGGFQVIRAPRPGQQAARPATGVANTRPQSQQRAREPSWKDENNEPMGSTAMAAATSLSRPHSMHGMPSELMQPRSQSSPQPLERIEPQRAAAKTPDASSPTPSLPPTLELPHFNGSGLNLSSSVGGQAGQSRPTSFVPTSALGILGADMQRAASEMGHDDAEEDARRLERNDEARYWLPSKRNQDSGDELAQGSGARRQASKGSWDTTGGRRAEGLSAKIELMDP